MTRSFLDDNNNVLLIFDLFDLIYFDFASKLTLPLLEGTWPGFGAGIFCLLHSKLQSSPIVASTKSSTFWTARRPSARRGTTSSTWSKFELIHKYDFDPNRFNHFMLLLWPDLTLPRLTSANLTLKYISYIKMKVCMCVCVCVRRPAAGPTQPITPKFGMGSSFHPGSAPSQGATRNVDPWPRSQPRPLLLLSS